MEPEREQIGTVEEVFEQLMTFRKWEKKDLAEFLGLDPSTLSQKLGAHWNKHFQVFLKMLPLMVEAGMIDCKQLCGKSDKNGGNGGGSGGRKTLKDKRLSAKSQDLVRYIMSTFLGGLERFQELTMSTLNRVMFPCSAPRLVACN